MNTSAIQFTTDVTNVPVNADDNQCQNGKATFVAKGLSLSDYTSMPLAAIRKKEDPRKFSINLIIYVPDDTDIPLITTNPPTSEMLTLSVHYNPTNNKTYTLYNYNCEYTLPTGIDIATMYVNIMEYDGVGDPKTPRGTIVIVQTTN